MGAMKEIQIEIDNSKALQYLLHLINQHTSRIAELDGQIKELKNK